MGCAGGKAARTLLPAVYPGKGCAHRLVGRSDITCATACAMPVALALIQKNNCPHIWALGEGN